VEERLAVLEREMTRLDVQVTAVEQRTREDSRRVWDAIATERAAREAMDRTTIERIESYTVGSIVWEVVGAWWVIAGQLFGAFLARSRSCSADAPDSAARTVPLARSGVRRVPSNTGVAPRGTVRAGVGRYPAARVPSRAPAGPHLHRRALLHCRHVPPRAVRVRF
jgi:hypothetical protein